MSKYADRIKQGLCGYCGKNGCNCKERQRAGATRRRNLRLATGLCKDCNSEQYKGGFCSTCWGKHKQYQKKARRKEGAIWLQHKYEHKYNVEWCELKALYDRQEGCCALSGVPITIGVNASLDHIIPKAKGGTNTIENYQWVHSTTNIMKNAYPIEQFIEWCSLIAEHSRRNAK